MSSIGSPIDTSLLQTAQAQQVAGKARDKERAATERARRQQDFVELRVAGVEASEAVRPIPHSDSGEADAEHDHSDESLEDRPNIDLRA
ncbi:MAG: hypothetical protein KJO43_10365 [Phycisphaerae bacterium]|nr:hypothetical protein [Phycisphaerae bacterium]NNF42351.1 hypothetical protein [Phycisphaerales bacterium]